MALATETTATNTRLPSLTGLRFIAAFAVFIGHAYLTVTLNGSPVESQNWPITFGFAGVGFFFVLSGFVLTVSARAQDTSLRFLRRRLVKIVPNHLVAWTLALLVTLWAGASITTGQVVPSLFLANAWFADILIMRGINVPSWSLSVELIFYLAFPALYLGISRIRPERLWWWFGGFALGTLTLAVISHTALPGQPQLPGMHMSLWQNWLVYPFPPSRLLEFALGIVTARIVLTGRWIRLGVPAATLLLAAALVLQLLLPVTALTAVAPTALPTALVIAAVATADRSGRGTIFDNRVWTWLGEVSFALYIVHYPTLYFLQESVGFGSGHSATTSFLISLLLLLPALLVSWLLYSLVERPLVRRWSNPRPSRSDKVPAQRQGPGVAVPEAVAETAQ
ncbi:MULTISPECIES: acyltransferase [Protofrankia]|uniref:acyltransferase family protein n=1 Tax=Protofrankia TaxID=2994361 RepID=UPI000640591A|nr:MULTISPECIES: acyltransferase [Protofrankia]ONH33544.1 hypothetical protein BL254_19825 [Protofrankia sp. BMG5.30]